jgi:hypothetical protein
VAAAVGFHTDTFLILVVMLCFLRCVVGLAFIARCSQVCNPSAYFVNNEVGGGAAMPHAAAKHMGIEEEVLQKLPTVPFEATKEGERPECAICLSKFASGNEVRVLMPCEHAFHTTGSRSRSHVVWRGRACVLEIRGHGYCKSASTMRAGWWFSANCSHLLRRPSDLDRVSLSEYA